MDVPGGGGSLTPANGGAPASAAEGASLVRQLGLWGLAATGICSMLGAGINVVPVMIQRSVPGIGENVLPAFAFGALPAVLAGLAYAVLASAMPRAGGSYVFASRALGPYWGFVASFSQWFGLSIVIGVVSYLIVPFLRDIAGALEMDGTGAALETGVVRVGLSLALLWAFVWVNLRGLKAYERTVVPLMIVMFALGAIVIVAGFSFNQNDFAAALLAREGAGVPVATPPPLGPVGFLAASGLLFASFVGFDAIAQAGGEARNPHRALPLAILLAVLIVGSYYLLFTAAVYHTVPWEFVWTRAQDQDLTAPGLLGYVLPAGWTVAIVAGAAIALINDLPAMLLSVSRLVFAWAEDGIFPSGLARVHPTWRTPHTAILLSGALASVAIIGSHFAGDFFLGIDLMVTSMLVNFILMCISVLALPRRNPSIAADFRVLSGPAIRTWVCLGGIVLLGSFLVTHTWKDLTADVAAWYFRSTPLWIGVMTLGSLIYIRKMGKLRASGVDVERLFRELPPE
ncbi:APC family permease [Candidatus Palauibacter sp.]|uniref:APC family permease n=1 Tax=Candidatus Palauibacter sp. TaxID=3101350 RepID=UPI003AF23710